MAPAAATTQARISYHVLREAVRAAIESECAFPHLRPGSGLLVRTLRAGASKSSALVEVFGRAREKRLCDRDAGERVSIH